MPRFQAALRGASEVGFTVLSISISLIAVFPPILMMGGLLGRLFREFALTLSIAILVSLVISLTTTPMLCARILKVPARRTERRRRCIRSLRCSQSTNAHSAGLCSTVLSSCSFCRRDRP